jgi:YHS domain-containing protein
MNKATRKEHMKRTSLTMTALALLAGGLAQVGCTHTPGRSAEAEAKPYPLDYCLVTGDKLGEMGKPIVIVYRGQEFKFCCSDCPPKFKEDPEKYMKKLTAEEEKAKK